MKPFAHHNARSIREATRLLAEYDGKAKVNAGGTDLLGAMRDKCIPEYPEAVINIKTIDGLDYIKKDKKRPQNRRPHPAGRHLPVAVSKEEYALLAEAVHSVASPHIRNMATLGGNLAQDVRCWYYRYPRQIGGPIVCLRKGGKICNALAGDNRYHSLFGAAPLAESLRQPLPGPDRHTRVPDKVQKGDLPRRPDTDGIQPHARDHRSGLPRLLRARVQQAGIRRRRGDTMRGARRRRPRPRACGPSTMARPKRVREEVAVVGSGPAGLAAAFYLRKAGHRVTVYEKLPEAGGMLFTAYRLTGCRKTW